MEILSNEKLDTINGGGKTLWFVIGGAAFFFLGFVYGFVNPQKCN